ncbi:MAG TPA: GNAT family N-acetyltransferase [Candidatus Solibacter sp.]|nr:GNAT family N-acetyltransferase [Candidatus Solibacter sp.]
MPIDYRQAELSDAPVLLELMRGLQCDDPWSVPFEEVGVKAVVDQLLANPMFGEVWFVCDKGRPIGYVVLCFDYSLEYRGRGAWIDELYIADSHRGQGLGGSALRFAEARASDAGARVLHLEVNRGNAAIELYRCHGFVDHERYLMSKDLG